MRGVGEWIGVGEWKVVEMGRVWLGVGRGGDGSAAMGVSRVGRASVCGECADK